MNVELTIQEMYNEYPTLFIDRVDALNHLFCTIGNEYDWKNDELVSSGYSYPKKKDIEKLKNDLVDGKAFQHNKLSLRGQHQYYINQRTAEETERLAERSKMFVKDFLDCEQFLLQAYPDDKYHNYPRNMRWYFYLGDYCKNFAYLFNYPKNIKPDWLAAIEETKQYLKEDGYDLETPIDTKTNWELYREIHRQNDRERAEILKNLK